MLFSIFTNESVFSLMRNDWVLSPYPFNSLVTDDDGGPSPLHTKGGGGGDAAAPETGLLSWPGTVESENHFSALYVWVSCFELVYEWGSCTGHWCGQYARSYETDRRLVFHYLYPTTDQSQTSCYIIIGWNSRPLSSGAEGKEVWQQWMERKISWHRWILASLTIPDDLLERITYHSLFDSQPNW